MQIPFGLSANIAFPVATVVGERLLYLPSAGFCMLLSWALVAHASPLARGISLSLSLILSHSLSFSFILSRSLPLSLSKSAESPI